MVGMKAMKVMKVMKVMKNKDKLTMTYTNYTKFLVNKLKETLLKDFHAVKKIKMSKEVKDILKKLQNTLVDQAIADTRVCKKARARAASRGFQ